MIRTASFRRFMFHDTPPCKSHFYCRGMASSEMREALFLLVLRDCSAAAGTAQSQVLAARQGIAAIWPDVPSIGVRPHMVAIGPQTHYNAQMAASRPPPISRSSASLLIPHSLLGATRRPSPTGATAAGGEIARRLGFIGRVEYRHVYSQAGGAQYGLAVSPEHDLLIVFAEAFERAANHSINTNGPRQNPASGAAP